MKAYIIEDKDVRALLDAIKLARFEPDVRRAFDSTFWEQHQPACQQLLKDVHARFLYHLHQWLAGQGVDRL